MVPLNLVTTSLSFEELPFLVTSVTLVKMLFSLLLLFKESTLYCVLKKKVCHPHYAGIKCIHSVLNTPPQICPLCRAWLSLHCVCVVTYCLRKHGLGKGENMTSEIYFLCHKANTSRERLRKLKHADDITQQHHQQHTCGALLIKNNSNRSF